MILDIPYGVFKPNTISASGKIIDNTGVMSINTEEKVFIPLISCVMVTRGNLFLIKRSISSFLLQTWDKKELVIVTDHNHKAIKEYLEKTLPPSLYKLIPAPAGLTLGDLRNISVSNSSGDLIAQWDDDDIYHPERLSFSFKVLEHTRSPVIFLNRWTIVWPAKKLACVSANRVWEGSMLARREVIPIYPNKKKEEDTSMVDLMCKMSSVTLLDYPELYFYIITGENTNSDEHFERMFNNSSIVYEDYEEFKSLVYRECGVKIPD